MIPFGLSPQQHFMLGVTSTSPLCQLPEISNDLKFAIEKVATLGKGIDAWRKSQWKLLSSAFKKAWKFRASLAEQLSDSAKRVSSHLDPATIEILRLSIDWPDVGVAKAIVEGSAIIGDLDETHIFRKKVVESSLSIKELDSTNEEWIQQILASKPGKPDAIQVIWDKSKEEIKLNILEGWFSKASLDKKFGKGKWRPMRRFALYQEAHGSWRCIDNALTSSHNLATDASERIHTTSPEMGFAIAKHFRELLKEPLAGPLGIRISTRDMKRAYRQLSPVAEHLRHSIIAVWDPEALMWRFGIMHGLCFGLLSAVLQFNRHPALVVAIARRWLAIPAIHFFDDFKVGELAISEASGANWFD